jgi:hypothetical protein
MHQYLALAWVLILVSTSACSKQIQGFVESGSRRPQAVVDPIVPIPPPVVPPGSSLPYGVRLSPGGGAVMGTSIRAQIAINPSQRPLTGSQVSGRITIQQNRFQ